MTLIAIAPFLIQEGRTEAELGTAMSAAVFAAGRTYHRTGAHDAAQVTEAFAAACDYVDHLGPALDDRELIERDAFQDLRSAAGMTALPAAAFAAASHCNRVRMYRGDRHLLAV
ncbi:MAG TPA: hypothetical protein VF885_00930 [Arthrobacter sp.]